MPAQTTSQRTPAMGARFEEGWFLGPATGSNEALVMTPTGAVRARSIKRRPPSERWSANFLSDFRGTVLQPNPLNPDKRRIGVRAPVY